MKYKKSLFVISTLLLTSILSACNHNEGTVKYDDCREVINLETQQEKGD